MHTISKIKLAFILISFSLYSCGNSDTPVSETKEKEENVEIKAEETTEQSEKEKKVEEKVKSKTKEENIEELKSSTTKTEIIEETETENVDIDIIQKEEEETTEVIPTKKNWLDKGSFINAKIGKKLLPDYKGDLMNEAAEEIALKRSKNCGGENCGKIVQLQNFNSAKDINAAIEISWKENKETIKEIKEYLIPAGQSLEIGCTSDCNSGNKVKINWKIIGANYSS